MHDESADLSSNIPISEVTTTRISWEVATLCISGGTVESLRGLQRSKEGLESYRQHREQAGAVVPLTDQLRYYITI